MRVVDAGVVIELVANDLDPGRLGDEELAAPHLIDSVGDLSAYDATYVALTEMTGATALLTTDARLAGAPGINCPSELL